MSQPKQNIKVLDLSSISWQAEKGVSIPLHEMHTDHVIRALAWCNNRLSMSEKIVSQVPTVFKEDVLTHNGRKLSDWINIFIAVLETRADKIKEEKRQQLQAALDELETPEKKIERLQAELASL